MPKVESITVADQVRIDLPKVEEKIRAEFGKVAPLPSVLVDSIKAEDLAILDEHLFQAFWPGSSPSTMCLMTFYWANKAWIGNKAAHSSTAVEKALGFSEETGLSTALVSFIVMHVYLCEYEKHRVLVEDEATTPSHETQKMRSTAEAQRLLEPVDNLLSTLSTSEESVADSMVNTREWLQTRSSALKEELMSLLSVIWYDRGIAGGRWEVEARERYRAVPKGNDPDAHSPQVYGAVQLLINLVSEAGTRRGHVKRVCELFSFWGVSISSEAIRKARSRKRR
ncbi:MAG: hypothetical protein HOH43_21945 [Candidatus Latescibacteria bacterium]|jgi:hypothetical protein|nr:hypothetical protein [Candidatus Latescibacterota bacterium]